MQLSPHFWHSEFVKSKRARRLGIPNVPNQRQIDNAQRLCVELREPLRVQTGPI